MRRARMKPVEQWAVVDDATGQFMFTSDYDTCRYWCNKPGTARSVRRVVTREKRLPRARDVKVILRRKNGKA